MENNQLTEDTKNMTATRRLSPQGSFSTRPAAFDPNPPVSGLVANAIKSAHPVHFPSRSVPKRKCFHLLLYRLKREGSGGNKTRAAFPIERKGEGGGPRKRVKQGNTPAQYPGQMVQNGVFHLVLTNVFASHGAKPGSPKVQKLFSSTGVSV